MIKVNDRVYHVYNMSLKGVVERIQQETAQTWLAEGPAHGKMFAYVRLRDDRVIRLPTEDLMRDD
jgi:hypothetical protein